VAYTYRITFGGYPCISNVGFSAGDNKPCRKRYAEAMQIPHLYTALLGGVVAVIVEKVLTQPLINKKKRHPSLTKAIGCLLSFNAV
jgi:hypothetical protein